MLTGRQVRYGAKVVKAWDVSFEALKVFPDLETCANVLAFALNVYTRFFGYHDHWLNLAHLILHSPPAGIAYVTDSHKVRALNLATLQVTTVAGTGVQGTSGDGGPATQAQLSNPTGLCKSSTGKRLYIVEAGSHRIRSLDLNSGTIST